MSKGLGQKIVIKFTEDLVGNVSGKDDTATPYSFYRWYITSTWSSSGRLYLYELEFFSSGVKVNANKIISMAGSSRFSSSYDVNRLFDGSVPGTEWDANGPLPHWVRIELDEAIVIDSFRWHTGTSGNKPKEFILQGANDGINWVDIYTDESPNLNNWIDFVVAGVGNEIAFTVTGKEYQYVNGPLIDKEYRVDKVERYPIQRVWELGESLALDGPGEMAITDAQCYETTSGTTLTGTVQTNAGDIVLATISHRSTFTTPAGWTKIYESAETDPTWKQRMVFAIKQVDSAGQVSFKATQSTAGRMYLNLISISGIQGIEFVPELEVVNLPNTSKPVSVPDKVENEMLIWGCTAPLWKSSPAPYGDWVTSPNDLTLVSLNQATTQPRQANFIDDGTGQATGRTFNHSPSTTNTECIIAAVRLVQEYDTPKIHTSQPIQLSGEYRIKWLENKPESTDILIEYTTGETQGQWQEVSNGEVINIDTNLWIRATLSTEDEVITPILQNLWLEEVPASQDKILITMHPQSRFNNVEGDLTVKYDALKGNLSGRGGPVEGFTETFTPTDLEPKPNPHVAETIAVKPEIELQFLRVEYHNRFEQDIRITAKPSISIEFINVGEINP